MKRELNKKERLFVQEYLNDEKLNAEKAAIKAGYSTTVARTKAYVWVSKSKQNDKRYIAEAIEEMMMKRLEKLNLSGEHIVKEVANIAFFDLSKVIAQIKNNKKLTMADIKKLNPELLSGVSEISIENGVIKIKAPWKMKALELLGKKFKLWEGDGEGVKYVVEVIRGRAEDK